MLIISGLAFLLLAVLVTVGMTQPLDQAIITSIHTAISPIATSFFLAVTQFGGSVVVTAVSVAILAVLLLRKKRQQAIFFSAVMAGMLVLNVIFKHLIGRQRPDAAGWLVHETGLSFPSGHATAVMALGLALCVLLWSTAWRWVVASIAAIYIIVISVSRLYLGVHFPSDILGGWLLSIAWVSAVALILRRWYPARRVVRR